MDLRPYIRTPAQLREGVSLIRDNRLFYQPFILADEVEVGEGRNFCEDYRGVDSVFDGNAYAPGHDIGARRQADDPAYFRQCNAEYRAIYTHIADELCARTGGLNALTVAEIGCNTGLLLFMLAQRGAKACRGYDSNAMQPVFSWLNRVLGTRVAFRRGRYDSLYHRFRGFDVPQADIMINTVFTNHQCDPLQFLAYLCDRARRGVFLWMLTEPGAACTVTYPAAPPHGILPTGQPFPLYFNNGVALSEPLLMLALRQLGFADVEALPPFIPGPRWANFQQGFRMYYAHRTSPVRSAYWQRRLPMQIAKALSRTRNRFRTCL